MLHKVFSLPLDQYTGPLEPFSFLLTRWFWRGFQAVPDLLSWQVDTQYGFPRTTKTKLKLRLGGSGEAIWVSNMFAVT